MKFLNHHTYPSIFDTLQQQDGVLIDGTKLPWASKVFHANLKALEAKLVPKGQSLKGIPLRNIERKGPDGKDVFPKYPDWILDSYQEWQEATFPKEEPQEEPLNSRKKDELVSIAKQLGLSTEGTKADLLSRLEGKTYTVNEDVTIPEDLNQ